MPTKLHRSTAARPKNEFTGMPRSGSKERWSSGLLYKDKDKVPEVANVRNTLGQLLVHA
ncbi:MAG: hypothetical protein IPI00_02930 [Flavobacteriales bacterium]|nr:hypothetical protein [Flavobacteriales bacterium]MBK6945929.1 hypothetical protein [Flavobacteriales bacterium]MBK7239136.1 hypothetical protein [Flavobacteriales bacterium]MBK7296675.1 hypothetical protein [Flavobacteriales bacterium]MBK9536758.1 hypothetical protein [Flavobacteriales bacterium]